MGKGKLLTWPKAMWKKNLQSPELSFSLVIMIFSGK